MSDVIKPRMPFDASRMGERVTSLGKRLLRNKWFWIIAAALLLFRCGSSCATAYVPPDMVGIRQVYYGGGAGIKTHVYGPGTHFIFRGYERLHLFPHNMQVVNFSDSRYESLRGARSAPAIKVQTSDGYNVVLDVTVLYRVQDPHKVFTEAGPGRAFEDRLVIPRADRILRRTLGELNAEEFYQGPKRIEKTKLANDQLRTELAPVGINLDAVLIRNYTYDQKYQELIEGRKIKDQTVFLRQAEAKAAIEERKRDTIIAEGKANQQTELSRGAAEVQKINAQADLYKRKQAAEGNLLLQLAEAQGTKMENDAMQGAGSENMVGLKMADVMGGVKVMVIPSDGPFGMNPLDVSALLRKFEVK
jgi:regulator of protease activity HflC (stomatin/prohibitin superfamily)